MKLYLGVIITINFLQTYNKLSCSLIEVFQTLSLQKYIT